jgi:hypothetical protein
MEKLGYLLENPSIQKYFAKIKNLLVRTISRED